MKEIYERPKMLLENFTPNRVIADCKAGSINFQCLQGGDIDKENVLNTNLGVTGCSQQAGYTYDTIHAYKKGSTKGSAGTYTSNGNQYYDASSSASGLLYICKGNGITGYSTSNWEIETVNNAKYLVHSNTHTQGVVHCMVSGFNSSTVTES